MKQFDYHIKTSNSESSGLIEAESEEDAKKILYSQHVPNEHTFVDENGETKEHVLIDLTLTDID